MDFAKHIKHLRKNVLGLSRKAFGEQLGVSMDVINNIELNRLARPEQKEPLLKLICKEFGVNYKWLTTGAGEMFSEPKELHIDKLVAEYNLGIYGRKIIEYYLNLEKRQRDMFEYFLETFVESCNAETTVKPALIDDAPEVAVKRYQSADVTVSDDDYKDDYEDEDQRELPLYEFSAAAGAGLTAYTDYSLTPVPDGVPLSAHYAMRIKGRSMEPLVPDGSVVWVRQQPDVDEGEICIVVIGEDVFCKRKGPYYFESVNTDYPHIEVRPEDTYRIQGKVVAVTKDKKTKII
jgi:SOS-response transcriptional repressor LexA